MSYPNALPLTNRNISAQKRLRYSPLDLFSSQPDVLVVITWQQLPCVSQHFGAKFKVNGIVILHVQSPAEREGAEKCCNSPDKLHISIRKRSASVQHFSSLAVHSNLHSCCPSLVDTPYLYQLGQFFYSFLYTRTNKSIRDTVGLSALPQNTLTCRPLRLGTEPPTFQLAEYCLAFPLK